MYTQTTRPLHLPAPLTPRRGGPGRPFGIAEDLPIPRECRFLIATLLAIGARIAVRSRPAARAFVNFSNLANFAKPPRQTLVARALLAQAALAWAWLCGVSNALKDDSKRVTGTIDPLGGLSAKQFDSEDHVVVTTDAAGHTTKRAFDDAGNMVTTTDPAGNTTQISYTTSNVVQVVTDPAGHETHLEHDDLAQVTAQVRTVETSTGPQEVRVAYTYDVDGNPASVTNPTDAVTEYAHDDSGRVTQVTGPAVPVAGTTGTTRPVTTMQYDLEGQTTARTDSLGRSSIASFDAFGNKASETDALGNTTLYAYSDGRLVATTDPLGRTTRYQYDESGQLLKVTDALNGATEYGYDLRGNRVRVVDQRGHVTLTSYDALSRTTSVVYPDGATIQMSYDSVGNIVATTDPLGHVTRFEYDLLGHQTAKLDPDGGRTDFEFDAAGNRTAIVRGAGTSLQVRDEIAYDALGRVIAKTRAKGTPDEITVRYEHDLANNVTAIVTGRGKRWTFAYDAGDRLVSETDPLGHTGTYSYDAAGHLVEKRDPKGQKIQYDYDMLGRCTEARYIRADGSLENRARVSYDAVGNMARVTASNVDIEQDFDALNRLTVINHHHFSKTQVNEYDVAGNRTAMHVTGMTTSVMYEYDSRNQLTKIASPGLGDVNYTYNSAGQKTTLVYPSGIICSYSYDVNGRLHALDYRQPNHEPLFFEELHYDPRGNIVQRIDDDGAHQYGYDLLDQLVRVDYPDESFEAFSYDASGNRSSLTTAGGAAMYEVDDADRLISVTGPGQSEVTTFGWTPNGEMASQLASGQTTCMTFTWDTRSMLVALSTPSGDIITFTYLPEQYKGWRSTAAKAPSSGTAFLWDTATWNLLANFSEQLTYLYTSDSRLDAPLGVVGGVSGSKLLLPDHLGTVSSIVETSSTSASRRRHSVFGIPLSHQGAATTFRLAFCGREQDSPESLTYLRSRYYSPRLGRFLTVDPIHSEQSAGVSDYTYSANSPIVFRDPTGLKVKVGVGDDGKRLLVLVYRVTHENYGIDEYGYLKQPANGVNCLTEADASANKQLALMINWQNIIHVRFEEGNTAAYGGGATTDDEKNSSVLGKGQILVRLNPVFKGPDGDKQRDFYYWGGGGAFTDVNYTEAERVLAHELWGHAYYKMTHPSRYPVKPATPEGDAEEEYARHAERDFEGTMRLPKKRFTLPPKYRKD